MLVKLNNVFRDFSVSYPVENPGMKFNSDVVQDYYLVLEETFEHIHPLFSVWRDYLKALGLADDEYNSVNNVGIVKRKRDGKIETLCPSFFVNNNGQMNITVGSYTKFELNGDYYEFYPTLVPVFSQLTEQKQGKKTVSICEYYILTPEGQIDIEMYQSVPDKDGKISSYAKLEYYNDEGTPIECLIPFVLSDEAKKLSGNDIRKAWVKGEFLGLLKPPMARGNFIEGNKAFRELFATKTFPSTGIQLLVKNGKEVISTFKDGSTISKVRWEIVMSSHPDVSVKTVTKIDDKWVDDYCLLDEAKFISFTSAANNVAYHFIGSNNFQEYPDHALIWITRPAANTEHSPFSLIFVDHDDIHENCFNIISDYIEEHNVKIPVKNNGFKLDKIAKPSLKGRTVKLLPSSDAPKTSYQDAVIDVEEIAF